MTIKEFLTDYGYYIYIIVFMIVLVGGQLLQEKYERDCREKMIAVGKTSDEAIKLCK